ncbi:LPXTG cell wall anchor domain-containing protein [Vagococcus fluvialis]|uniref:LPXTG cell wall anchor domain-containing protein n=1 Tax=Vagococcus fluvialis TaxID=2738 RepID=UPI001D0B921C|nr:LPXTG cell wall anchor domain-containing protein [Vagococcus fluvialis]UDM70219.1 LPXTG cell wall anchor domain-containing protein [Vagococcus fluvialis]UDM77638.1 LPXTG cell wall anchor domain-containing protein [Vagococcus fluvialis]UDM81908.1 LPXTG cell wall anchor domain-containing protein [Vagococcus fluvialis]
MKKHTVGFTLLTLICVPFLVATTSVVNAEDTQSTSESSTEISSVEDSASKETSEIEVPKKTNKETTETSAVDKEEAKPFKIETKSLTGEKGQIKLAKIGTVEPKGEFEVFENEFIKVEKDGSWVALKDGKTKFTLKYTLFDDSLKEIQKENSDYIIKKTNTTEEISAELTKTSPQKANIKMEIVGGNLVDIKGHLKIKVVDGPEVTGKFTEIKPVSKEPFTLESDGSYIIGEKAKYEKLNQEVEFTLDQASYDKLAALPENSGKTVEKTYKMTVTKKAQKDITIKFKNKGINTVVGCQGRLLLEDTVEGVKIEEMEKVKFKPLDNNDFLSIDELGNWTALKAGEGPLKPAVTLDDKTMTALKTEFKDYDINIESETVNVVIKQTGTDSDGGTKGKKYEPVATLPQTGEEKLRFASITGIVILVLVGIFFFVKRKKSTK